MRKLALLCCSAGVLLFANRAQAHEVKYRIFEMNGLLESPVNDSTGIGSGLVTFDLDLFTMRLEAQFSGLKGNTTASHIHCCTLPTAGVATQTPSFTGFPLGVTAGTYDHTFDMTQASSYNAPFVTANGNSISAAFQALLNGADAGVAYLNIHSSYRSGGEIRGFLQFVPEPSSFVLAAMGMAAFFARRRKR